MLIQPTYEIVGGSSEPIHYLYAMAVLFVIELLIMLYLNHFKGVEEWEAPNAGVVDMTPWKYRKVVAVIGIILAIAIYLLLSPLGIAASGEPTSWLSVWGIAS